MSLHSAYIYIYIYTVIPVFKGHCDEGTPFDRGKTGFTVLCYKEILRIFLCTVEINKIIS